jgi:hypothetical protein
MAITYINKTEDDEQAPYIKNESYWGIQNPGGRLVRLSQTNICPLVFLNTRDNVPQREAKIDVMVRVLNPSKGSSPGYARYSATLHYDGAWKWVTDGLQPLESKTK